LVLPKGECGGKVQAQHCVFIEQFRQEYESAAVAENEIEYRKLYASIRTSRPETRKALRSSKWSRNE
jgi:hypothetical protein